MMDGRRLSAKEKGAIAGLQRMEIRWDMYVCVHVVLLVVVVVVV